MLAVVSIRCGANGQGRHGRLNAVGGCVKAAKSVTKRTIMVERRGRKRGPVSAGVLATRGIGNENADGANAEVAALVNRFDCMSIV